MKLTPKQRKFIDGYFLHNMNATRAAIYAGYSKKTAKVIGYENLTKPYIAKEIEKRLDESAMSANEVIARIAEQARAEYSQYITVSGVDLERLIEEGKAHLIKKIKPSSVRVGEDGELVPFMEIEFFDSQSALRDLGKYHKLFTDKREVSGPDGGPVEVKQYVTVSPDDWDDEG